MNNWFLISIIAPLLWSINTHTDKYVLSKYFKGNGTGAVFLFSALFSILVAGAILLFTDSPVFAFLPQDIVMLLFVGALSALGFFSYLQALNEEESSIVVPFLQLIPVFGFFLGYIFLGEVINTKQIFAGLLVILGLVIVSFEFDFENKIKLRKKFLIPIVLASFLFALHDVLFKSVAIHESFVLSLFWQYTGLAFIGVLIFFFVPEYRKQFYSLFTSNNKVMIGVNFGSEFAYVAGNIANNFATLLAPVFLVLVVSSYQPLFVFVIGTMLTIFFPKIATEKLSRRHLLQKVLSIVIVLIGSYLLYYS